MKLRRRYKWLIRIPFYLLLVVVIIGVLLYFFPVSGKWLDRRITEAFSSATRCHVEIRNARIYISRGEIRIDRITASPPDNRGEPIVLSRNRILFSLSNILSDPLKSVTRFSAQCPTEIGMVYKNGYIRPVEELSWIQDMPVSEGPPGKEKAERFLPEIRLNFNRISLSPPGENKTPWISWKNLKTDLHTVEGKPGFITFEGIGVTEVEAEFSGIVTFSPDGQPEQINMFLSHALASSQSSVESKPSFEAEGIRFSENLEFHEREILFNNTTAFDYFRLNLPSRNIEFEEKNLRTEIKGSWDNSQQKILLNPARIKLADSSITLDGSVFLKEGVPFSLHLEQKPVSRKIFNEISQLILPEKVHITLQPDSVYLNLNAAGKMHEKENIQLKGNIDFKNLAFRHEDFPFPMVDLTGTAEFDQNTLNCADVNGRTGNGNFVVSAELKGDPDLTRLSSGVVEWTARLSAGDVFTTIRNAIGIEKWDIDGRLDSSGILHLEFPDIKSGEQWDVPDFNMELSVRDGTMSTPFYRERMSGVSGYFTITPKKIEFSGLRGEAPGSALKADGSFSGKRFFWKNPYVHSEIQFASSVEKMLDLVPESIRRFVEKQDLRGSWNLNLNAEGPLNISRDMRYNGSLDLNNVSFSTDHPDFSGSFSDISGNVDFDNDSVYVHNIDGKFLDMPFQSDAGIGNDTAKINLKASLDLAELRNSIPLLIKETRMSGDADIRTEIILAGQNILQYLKDFKRPPLMAPIISGTIRPDGASFAYRDMPENLNNIRGTIIFTNRGLRFENLKLDCGKSSDCVTTGNFDFAREPRTLEFDLDIPEFFLEEWTRKWSSGIPSSRIVTMEEMGESSPTIEIRGNMEAQKMHFNRLKGKDLDFHFTYNYFPLSPNRFSFDRTSVKAYGGNLRGSGSLMIPSGRFFYGVEGETENVSLQPILTALRGEKEKLTGLLDSKITIAGRAGFPETISGRAEFDVKESRFIGQMVLKRLGEVLNSTIFNDIKFTRIQGEVDFQNSKAVFENITFNSPVLNLNASGSIDFHENLDITCYLIFQKNRILNLPILRQLAGILEFMGKSILKFKITGTASHPKVQTVPLSSNEILELFSLR